jgi:hypothetical protein
MNAAVQNSADFITTALASVASDHPSAAPLKACATAIESAIAAITAAGV